MWIFHRNEKICPELCLSLRNYVQMRAVISSMKMIKNKLRPRPGPQPEGGNQAIAPPKFSQTYVFVGCSKKWGHFAPPPPTRKYQLVAALTSHKNKNCFLTAKLLIYCPSCSKASLLFTQARSQVLKFWWQNTFLEGQIFVSIICLKQGF